MPDLDMDPMTPDTDPSAATDGYRPLDGSVDLTPPISSPIASPPGASDGQGYTWHALTDPALDQHYAGLANQYDPDPQAGVLGTFQQLPPDGIADRWRYTSPNIPGEQPIQDADGNPCAAWLVSRPIWRTGGLAYHSFVVVADHPGDTPKARFSFGPADSANPKLVSLTGVPNNDTDRDDKLSWQNWNNSLAGVHIQQIPASDASVIAQGKQVTDQVGTPSHPGSFPYGLVPEISPSGYANSNTAAAAVANGAIWRDPRAAKQLMAPPGTNSPGWGAFVPGAGWPFK